MCGPTSLEIKSIFRGHTQRQGEKQAVVERGELRREVQTLLTFSPPDQSRTDVGVIVTLFHEVLEIGRCGLQSRLKLNFKENF